VRGRCDETRSNEARTDSRSRRVAVIGSLAVHLVVGAVLLLAHRDGSPRATDDATMAIELVDVALTLPLNAPSSVSGAAGSPGAGSPAARVVAHDARASARRRSLEAATADLDPRGRITFERAGGGDGERGGDGGGGSGAGVGGRGNGLGIGASGSREPVPPPPEAPRAEPVVSKARPARLVYPRRNRDVDDGETFVARVTIDEDGYVVGAKLVRGFGGRRDDEAAGLIFRFRYAPALDEAGRPIQSTLDQNFLVE